MSRQKAHKLNLAEQKAVPNQSQKANNAGLTNIGGSRPEIMRKETSRTDPTVKKKHGSIERNLRCAKSATRNRFLTFNFSFLHADAAPNAKSTLSGYCNPRAFGHPPTAFPRRSDAAAQAGYPPYPESWPSHSEWCRWARHPK